MFVDEAAADTPREVVESGEGAEAEEGEEVLSPINRKEEEEGIRRTNEQGPKEVKFLLFTNYHRVSTWMETFSIDGNSR